MAAYHLAIDLGASHGRVIAGRCTEAGIKMEVAHRFGHTVRERNGRLRWDFRAILSGVREGLRRASLQTGDAPVASIGCDGWSQDFGLLDDAGRLVYAPCSYRDPRTRNLPDRLAPRLTWQELHRRNGAAIHRITTLCQLKAMAESERAWLQTRPRLLHIADLIHHALCGAIATDWTLATASQLWNIESDEWDLELLARLDIPAPRLPAVHRTPAIAGRIPVESAPHPKLAHVPVVVTAGHDTAAATAVLHPAEADTFFLSLGSWAMLGCFHPDPLRTASFPPDRTIGYFGLPFRRWGIFRGGAGLWPIQQCMEEWQHGDPALTWSTLEQAAADSPYAGCVDLRHASLEAPPRMTEALDALCRANGQPLPAAPGDYTRMIYRSLATSLAEDIHALARFTGRAVRAVSVVGGGTRSALLCRLLSEASGLRVRIGPAEAAAMGNLLLQAIALEAVPNEPGYLQRISASLFKEIEP